MLKECWRVLKDGGKMRISTPDLAFLISLYQTDKSHLKEFIRWLTRKIVDDAPFCDDTFVINYFYAGGATCLFTMKKFCTYLWRVRDSKRLLNVL